jgi:hypothetical protein
MATHTITERTRFGRDAGLLESPDDFDQPLPDKIIASFEK